MRRHSTGQLMAAVLVVALLIPFPFRAILAVLILILVYMIPIYIILILDVQVHPRLAVAIILLLAAFGWALGLAAGPGQFLPIRGGPNWVNWANFAVRPMHWIGPIILGRHFWRRDAINSGLIIWAWIGIVSLGLPLLFSRNSHGSSFHHFDLLIEFARLTAVLAVGLLIYGKRPSPSEPRWSYYVGWGLAEYDAILWGCYSGWWLLYE
jgi:hypothetical protein